LPKDTDPVMRQILHCTCAVSASNTHRNMTEFIPERALDGNAKTYGAINENITTATLKLNMENLLMLTSSSSQK